jgi:hypothetical protein
VKIEKKVISDKYVKGQHIMDIGAGITFGNGVSVTKQPPIYYVGVLQNSNSYNVNANGIRGRGITVDSSGNIYAIGDTWAPGWALSLQKYNSSGVLQWQTRISDTVPDQGGNGFGFDVHVDTSGNIYVVGFQSNRNGQLNFTAKLNSSGGIVWQGCLGSGDVQCNNYGVISDSSGNVYSIGSKTGWQIQTLKYNSAGSLQWKRQLGSSVSIGRGIAIDSSNNLYITGLSDQVSGAAYNIVTAKYDTSGAIQWQRSLGNSASVDEGHGIGVDSSGNSYIVGISNTSGNNNIIIAKYDTSGPIQWQRTLGGSSVEDGAGIAVDSSGNSYVVGTSNNIIIIAKYDTSGTIQWQRTLSSGTSTDNGMGIILDDLDNFYVAGYFTKSSLFTQIVAKFPTDGTKTGTYSVAGTTFTYSASTLTEAASTLTASTSTLTEAVSNLSTAGAYSTATATTYTATVNSFT